MSRRPGGMEGRPWRQTCKGFGRRVTWCAEIRMGGTFEPDTGRADVRRAGGVVVRRPSSWGTRTRSDARSLDQRGQRPCATSCVRRMVDTKEGPAWKQREYPDGRTVLVDRPVWPGRWSGLGRNRVTCCASPHSDAGGGSPRPGIFGSGAPLSLTRLVVFHRRVFRAPFAWLAGVYNAGLTV